MYISQLLPISAKRLPNDLYAKNAAYFSPDNTSFLDMATNNELTPERIKALKQKRRAKKKARRQRKDAATDTQVDQPIATAPLELEQATLQHFTNVLKHFSIPTVAPDHNDQQIDEEEPRISKKQVKRLTQLTIDELKQLVDLPEVVEPWDVTASDPMFLVALKSYRNTIPVPNHWAQRKAYLQNRKERPRWELPDFIKQTGIAEVRDAIKEKEAAARRSAKRRARLNPKLGKMDLDYQKLHDAFYRFQAKPVLTGHGDLYYEGKEQMSKFKPGKISETLKEALDQVEPPPWLYSMQRFGPPPSYPHLVIPGVNAPIPKNARWGYGKGEWGQPPVDPLNRPLYGDVFNVLSSKETEDEPRVEVDHTLWGELEPEEGDYAGVEDGNHSDSDESTAHGEPSDEAIEDELLTEMPIPETIELRKKPLNSQEDQDDGDKPLYQVLEPVASSSAKSGRVPSQHVYHIPQSKRSAFVGQDVDVAIEDPTQIESQAALRAKYEEAQERETKHEDLSDMHLEHVSQQAKMHERRERVRAAKRKDMRF